MQNISIERLCEVCEALKTNTQLETLELASTAATDKVAKVIFLKGLSILLTLPNLHTTNMFQHKGVTIRPSLNFPKPVNQLEA